MFCAAGVVCVNFLLEAIDVLMLGGLLVNLICVACELAWFGFTILCCVCYYVLIWNLLVSISHLL